MDGSTDILESLLVATFGSKDPFVSGNADKSENFSCAGNCSPLATYSPYVYTFTRLGKSTLRVSNANVQNLRFGNYPVPVLIHGKAIACNIKGTKFLTSNRGASSFTLSCLAPKTPHSSPTATSQSKRLPLTVESEEQMQANGNGGPPSSILIPVSCEQTGTTITAEGSYQDGFAPEIYNRYGDIVELYVFGAVSSGYPQGPQLAASSTTESPAIGGSATWQVSTKVDSTLVDQPARCVIAAQPTHDLQLAP